MVTLLYLKMNFSNIIMRSFKHHRPVLTCTKSYTTSGQNPITKTWKIISRDLPFGGGRKKTIYPEHADIIVIGGGFIGSSVAYWLKHKAGEGINVVVLEKDVGFHYAQTNFLQNTLIQHFGLPENIYLAQYGGEFLRDTKNTLGIDIEFCPKNHLVLASEKYAEKLEHNVSIQKEFGIRNELLSPDIIKKKYPWINTKDIHLGCIGTESEGSINSWNYLKGLVFKSIELGATYLNAEVTGFELELQKDVLMEGIEPGTFKKINKVKYRTPDNEEYSIKFAGCVLAAGMNSGSIAKLANVGTGDGLLEVPLPIEKREESIYCIESLPRRMDLNTPMILDTSGLWLRKESLENNLFCGHVPLLDSDLTEEEYYNKIIKPSLINRVPEFKDVQVKKVSKEYYDYNTFDETGILGPHPYYNNLFIASGFGKYGCQLSPGIGRAITELIIDSNYTTIDLTRLNFDRLFTDCPLIESNIY